MTKTNARLPEPEWGILIKRGKPLAFTFDGKRYRAFEGDVIASALYAQGRSLISRSFKYHRPRGVLTMAGHDSNAIVQSGNDPNVRADRQTVCDGMQVKSVNHGGSLNRDWLAALGIFKNFLPVGFYYKTFFRPARAWPLFEKLIRRMAGLGSLNPEAEHSYYDKAYLHCDVLVVGGGAAGLEAAIASAEAGADTILIDEWPELGGSLLFSRGGQTKRQDLIGRTKAQTNLRIFTDTTVTGLFEDNWASAISAKRLYKIRSKETILATGGFDQPAVFKNNDLPGIMFANAAQRLMRLYAVRPGQRAVVVTANRFGYEAALDLLDAGIEVAAVADLRVVPDAPDAIAALTERGVRLLTATAPVAAKGKRRVSAIALSRLVGEGLAEIDAEWINSDLVLMSVGYASALNLASHAGAKITYDPEIAMHRATELPEGLSLAGAAGGIWTEAVIAEDSRRAGLRAAELALRRERSALDVPLADPLARAVTYPYPIFKGTHGHEFVDFDEDLQIHDIEDALADGYRDIQLVKRYSTVGMGLSQGRHSNVNTNRIVARTTGQSLVDVGTVTFRPPLVPEKFAHMAGRAFEPVRLTPMHQAHVALNAKMMTAGLWLRPASYGEDASAITDEVKAVRESAGLIDVSTLGKLEVRGPDAALFMERVYTGAFAKQEVGRARYALMTDETGVIIDDGIAARFHPQHFYVTATTGAIDQVWRHVTLLNTQWRLDVDLANVTAAYATMNIAGPDSRRILQSLNTSIDFSSAAFPYMAARQGVLAEIPVRILRVGFVGELGYEIHCPSGYGAALWEVITKAGVAYGLKPFGVEAQRLLRLEKGHIIVGQDTDGLTNPLEAGMEWALAKSKPYHVGQRSIAIQRKKGISRRLTGFTLASAAAPCPKECHLVIENGKIAGRVTSAAYSQSLGKVVGLAYVPFEKASTGSAFNIRIDDGRMIEARVETAPFYDPHNKRQEI